MAKIRVTVRGQCRRAWVQTELLWRFFLQATEQKIIHRNSVIIILHGYNVVKSTHKTYGSVVTKVRRGLYNFTQLSHDIILENHVIVRL